jgi:hypothetical protein
MEVAVTEQFGPGKMTPRSPYPCPIRGGQDLSSLKDVLISFEPWKKIWLIGSMDKSEV